MADAISYALTVNGRAAGPEILNAIKQIDVEDHAELADMLRLRLAVSVKENGSGWTILDDGLFDRLVNIKLSITIGSGNSIPLIDAYVIESTAQFSNDPGNSVLTVVAMDPTVLMHLEEKVKAWPNMADSDVASSIFSDGAYGFNAIVEATNYTRDENDHTLTQRGTDIQFLQQLAERNGYECFVELNPSSGAVEGHFHPPRHDEQAQGVLSVNMGAATNVNAFRARFDMLKPATVQATTLEVENASDEPANADTSSQTEMGGEPSTSNDRPRKVLLSGLGMGQAGEVQRYAQAVVDRNSWSLVAEGELNTLAYGNVLRAKRPVMLRGAGRQFSGRYYVERVLHTIKSDGSYVQKFTLRRNAVGLTGSENFQEDNAIPA